MLKNIEKADLIPCNPEEDGATHLTLDDYDWMNYTLTTIFNTSNQGKLAVVFEYYGCVDSSMTVTQVLDGHPKITKEYQYRFSSKVFEQHLVQFMQAHVESWKSQYAFCGEDIVLQFYNDVLNQGTLEY